MKSYTVCARTGCNVKITYDPKVDNYRPRYCKVCEDEIASRLIKSGGCSDADIISELVVRVVKG